MTYRDYEDSLSSGQLIELFDFSKEDGQHWRYTTSASDVVFLLDTYIAAAIRRSDVVISGDASKETLTVDLWKGAEIATQYVNNLVDGRLSLTIYRQHVDQYVQFWSGAVVGTSFNDDGVPTFTVDPDTASRRRCGHRRCNQRSCDHALFGQGFGQCGVIEANFTVTGVVLSVLSTVVVASEFATQADGWFVGGKLTIGDEVRVIKQHVTSTVTVNRPFNVALAGDAFSATAGCDHTPTTCRDKFDNKLNFGGNEYLQEANPFAGNSVMY